MKSTLLAILLLFIPKLVVSQSADKKIFLDSTWNETTSENYKYYRIIKDYSSDKELYTINDYYKNGVLQMEGTSKTKDDKSKEGEFVFYYENGNKKAVTHYIKSRPNGKSTEWYENGNKKIEREFIENKKNRPAQIKINQFWDANGVQKVVDGNGFLEDQGENESVKGALKNGFKEGTWEGSSTKFGISYKETYQDGKLISGTSTDKNGETYHYTEAEVRPNPKKGLMDFYKFIAKNYNIPNSLPKDASGKIYITFVVDKEGKIVEPKILRDLGYGTGQEAARIITAYDGFTPGEQRGRKVRCTYSIPISIQARR
jgi:antitoxin component YwqK of YwqJK toxin-antitoxin module